MILDAATFPESNQPPIYYPGMMNPPTDKDLKTFIYEPPKRGRPTKISIDEYIRDTVIAVSAQFGLNQEMGDVAEKRGQPVKPTAVMVVAEALRRITDGHLSSQACVRKSLQRLRDAKEAIKGKKMQSGIANT